VQSRIAIAERAFQLARSGTVSNLDDIRRALRREGYKADALQGLFFTVSFAQSSEPNVSA
jgi:hypothetical protein